MGYVFRSEDLRKYRPTQTPMPPGGFLNYKEAACVLGTRTEVVGGLVIHGVLSSPNKYSPGLAKLIPAWEVERFAAHYVDASILAKRAGSTTNQLRSLLGGMELPTLHIPISGKGDKIFLLHSVAAMIKISARTSCKEGQK
jgi:hypothetical protein